MRVLLLAENWPPRQGGIENYLSAIAANLPPQSVTVVVPPGSIKAVGGGIAAVHDRRFFWPLIKPSWLPLLVWLWRTLRREPVDVMVCGKALFEGLIAYYLKKYLGLPYVVCTYAMEIQTWRQSPWVNRKLRRVLAAADRIVYINDKTKQSLVAAGAREEQLVKIWPGVASAFLRPVTPQQIQVARQKYNVRQPYILCVGRLVPRKGIDLLIESFAQLDQTKFSDTNLVIVGQGPERDRLKKIAQQNYVTNSVQFLDNVPTLDLPAIYAGSLFFALTPRERAGDSEGFGIVYLEAAAQGRAVVGTTTGGVTEAVLDQQTGILVRPEVALVTGALTQLLSDRVLRQQLGGAGRSRVIQEFDWHKRIVLVKGMLDSIVL